MRTTESQKALFSMDPSTPEPSPEDRALVCCLLNMRGYVASFKAFETLQRLFIRGRIAVSDLPPWEISRWRERYMAEDENEQPLRDEDYPNIGPDDFLAWVDPFDFGAEHHWNTYKEKDFKLILEDAFTYWAKESPKRRKEFSEALAIYGMKL